MASALLAKGKAEISINPQETEAKLIFSPDPEGDGWDISAINKLAHEKNLAAPSDIKALETFLAKAGRAKNTEPLEFIFAQGVPPEEPIAEKVSWEPLPAPGEVEPFKEETLSKAAAPKVYRTRVERIKHEEKLKKSGVLSFMPGKEEVKVSWEKKESREEAKIDREVIEVKYANRGKKLGTVTPSIPGKPGKNIFGRQIPPPQSEDETFLLGDGIAKEKNELTAGVSGFIRIGKNWADIVPMSMHTYDIYTGSDGITLFLNFECGDERFKVPKGVDIIAEAVAKGSSETSFLSANEIDGAITKAVKTKEPLLAFALFNAQEAEARVEINHEKTLATLFLRKGVAGAKPLEMKEISQAIKESGIHGFDQEQLKAAIHTFMEGKEIVLSDYTLISGSPSTRGKDREVTVTVKLIPNEAKKLIFQRLEIWFSHGTSEEPDFDLDDSLNLAFVEFGDVIAKISEESEGEAGKDIFGNVIPGLPGNDPEIKLSNGLELHGCDIRCSRNGLLLFKASGKSFHGEVLQYQDAKIGIHISEDAMEARADLFLEEGPGIPLTIENIEKVMKVLGIQKGIDWEKTEKACAYAKKHGTALGNILAKGESPIARGGSLFKWLVPLNLPELAEVKSTEDSSKDEEHNAELRTIQIKAGVPIVEFSEPFAEGRAGYNVKGAEIPVDNGVILAIEHDESIREVSLKKGKRLIAARSGELSFDGKMLKVSSVKTINGDVTPPDGNIKFSGEIQISGNVLPGCVVIGASHVSIGGLAQEALISAGGKAVITEGFKGGGKGIVKARAGISTAFVERASVFAMGDVKLDKGSILSNIKTNGKLLVAAENGKISGGLYQARFGIESSDIGSEKGVHTELSIGQDYFIKDEITKCEEELSKIKEMLPKVEKEITNALHSMKSLPDELRREKIRIVKLLDQLNLKLLTLREKFEEHFDSIICVKGTVFPGVVIESHNRYYEVKEKRHKVVFYFDCKLGRIIEKPMK
jgi:uncharacterized protein (DUF342 family)